MKQSKEFKDAYQMGYSAGIAMVSQTELKIRQEERERIIKGIEQIKEAVSKRHGTYKYDSCYDDAIRVIKEI